jgi:valacyclovir hydrolase
MPTLELPDTVLHYETAGTGTPLLLLHGGLGTALLHFHREIPLLAERYRVIAPDLRGYGRSSPPRHFPPDFYHRDAADMAALLDAVAGEPAHVLGWSDGAIVALILAVTDPHLVRSVAIWGGQASNLEQERAAWDHLIETDSWPPRALERFKEAQGPENWPGILQRLHAGYSAILDAGGEIISRRLGEIRCPVLIIHGADDDIVPVVHAYSMHAAIPLSELHVWPGVGHLPHREREAEFRALVLEFLARN